VRDLRLLTGESSAMKAVRLALQQVATTDSTVLILGEPEARKLWVHIHTPFCRGSGRKPEATAVRETRNPSMRTALTMGLIVPKRS
jgi:hypothetical protein